MRFSKLLHHLSQLQLLFNTSMSSSFHLFLFSLFVFFFLSQAQIKPAGIILPVRKHNETLQYYTEIDMGTPLTVVRAVIDLGSQLAWFNCDSYISSSYRPVRCGSSKCKSAKGTGCVGCNSAPRPGCSNNTCGVSPYNPFKNLLAADGLGEDAVSVYETDGRFYLIQFQVPRFSFSCAASFLLEGLYSATKGVIGLARSQIALPTQLALAFTLPNKFSLCLPSPTEFGVGSIFIGGGPYYMSPVGDLSKSLTTTPLIINPVSTAPIYTQGDPSDEYFIGVKSIKVDRKLVRFNTSLLAIDKNGVGGTKLSTINPYTILHSSIFKALVSDFVKKAAAMKIKRVASVAPFGACFSSNTIASNQTGPTVPTIDLVLQSKSVYWRIYGANSMVEVNKDVLCLAFVDGGSKPRTSVILGGHQLEDNLLEFDLISNKLGFSSSLLLRNSGHSEGESSDKYFIDVKSIRVDGKRINFKTSLLAIDKNGVGGTKISTINPDTVLHSSIYKTLVSEFVKKAAAMKIKRVASVAPFGACFSSKTIASTQTGPAVPTIDQVLQSKNLYWRIYGANSMVKVNNDVLCLGFIDGGSKP
ncbi:hypothetical protein F0562_034729 [Nyssa sinensis]|uniref:Peptidase A1 domain-containing protein n=1 Tax=Nyssa sinensis TaxID=561372 RepID=A0A5J5ACT2_9ASTE|nr:hypothetical protein F0562_034729 [Nyssa sinensis]